MMNNSYKLVYSVFILILIISFTNSIIHNNYLVSIGAIIVLFIFNIVFSLINLNRRIIFLAFQITFFTFLLGKIVINTAIYNVSVMPFAEDIMNHIYISLFISLLFVFWGYYLYEHRERPKAILKSKVHLWNSKQTILLRKYSKYLLYLTAVPSLIITLEKVFFVQINSYVSYYTEFNSFIPIFIHKIALLFELTLFIFLATMPSKSDIKWPLILYFSMGLLSFGYGQRNGAVLNSLFILIYLFLRNSVNLDGKKWIKTKHVAFIIISVPFLLSFLYNFAFSRINLSADNGDIWTNILNFFSQQGGSVELIGYGKIYENSLPKHSLYSFGSLIDMFQQNKLLTILEVYPAYEPHTASMALYGHSYGQSISYLINPNGFLSGIGYGSCYIAEAWNDFGYIGIAVANFVYGAIMASIIRWCYKNIWLTAFSFFMITGLLYAPRSEVISFITSCFSISYLTLSLILYYLARNNAIKFFKRPQFTKNNLN